MSKASDTVSFDQLRNTIEGLYRTGKNSKLMPALATSSTVSKDGKTYTFTLRKSKWSDGSPVTAKDFGYSWRRTVNPKMASEYAYLFEGIKNSTAITAGKKPLSSLGVKAEGDYKLVVTLDRRIPYFKNLIAFALFFPQAEKALKKYGSNYGTASKYMLYNGPYMQKGWTGSNLSWKMVKNKYYLSCLLDQTGNQECLQRQPRRLAIQVRQREITKSVREHKCKKSLEKPGSFLL